MISTKTQSWSHLHSVPFKCAPLGISMDSLLSFVIPLKCNVTQLLQLLLFPKSPHCRFQCCLVPSHSRAPALPWQNRLSPPTLQLYFAQLLLMILDFSWGAKAIALLSAGLDNPILDQTPRELSNSSLQQLCLLDTVVQTSLMKLMPFAFRVKAFLGHVWPISADLAIPAQAHQAYKSLLNFLGGSVRNTRSRSPPCLLFAWCSCFYGVLQAQLDVGLGSTGEEKGAGSQCHVSVLCSCLSHGLWVVLF